MQNAAFLDRYLAGEHVAVWRELVDAGPAVRHEPLRNDAIAVARVTMQRVAQNLVTLHTRLRELGFEFAYPDETLVFARPDAAQRLDSLEAELGLLSISGRVWFETFHSVRFEQSEGQYEGKVGPDGLQGLGSHPALVVRPLEYGRDALADERRALESEVELCEPLESYPPTLRVGPVLSNCATAGFEMGAHHMDDLEFGMDGRDDASFINHLRMSIRSGGFPFWHFIMHSDIGLPSWMPQPNLERVMPYLTANLIEF